MIMFQRVSFAAFPLLIACCAVAHAESRCTETVATVVSAQGNVDVRSKDAQEWQPAKAEMNLCAGDSITVRRMSRALLRLEQEQTNVQLGEGSTLTLPSGKEQNFSVIELLKGVTHFISRVPHALKIKTPFVNASVEGTEFIVKVDDNQTLVSVTEGRVQADNTAGQLTLQRGQSALTPRGAAPGVYAVADPMESVQWALYYPHVFEFEPQDITNFGLEPWRAVVADSVRALRANDVGSALTLLEQAGDGINNTQYLLYRAHLLLRVGRVVEAQADIERALATDPGSGAAWALRAVIALTQNRREQSMTFAAEAVKLAPQSAAARIALSYVDQARFDLDAALVQMQTAVRNEPDNALAWSRLAEVWLMHGNVEEALHAAQTATQRQPSAPQAKTVLGFVHLLQGSPAAAHVVFEDAIRLDPSAPLPRLGLGLAYIRQGHLETGRIQLEIATSLEPRNSLLRSYAGKAYYEEKRGTLAGEQFALAKELDPKDPTPWFYNALLLQAQNRPGAALEELQKSIEFNDNRAVYRSRLLLDDDLAARGASQARIYQNLGFSQLALVEGYTSVNASAENYSAHRFLADAYAALPRHEIARVSELLQAQLLQPLNLNPLQPHLAESKLGILEGAGLNAAWNEYTPLFVQNDLALHASGLVGGNATRSDEIVQSGLYNNMSYSIGRFHYETEGFRANNDQTHDIYSLFAQVRASASTSVQVELRRAKLDEGDTSLRFDPDNFVPTLRHTRDRQSARIGISHEFTPEDRVIGSLIWHKAEDQNYRKSPTFELNLDTDTHPRSTELRYDLRRGNLSLQSGVGLLSSRKNVKSTSVIGMARFRYDKSSNVNQQNLYAYFKYRITDTAVATFGMSADKYEDADAKTQKANPKFGLVWQPAPQTTLRLAAFRSLRRALIGDQQTVEPTQVAGFNQFFDDPSGGSRAWRYGLGLDQRLLPASYVGLELSKRSLHIPRTLVRQNVAIYDVAAWEEYLGRAYWYWLPQPALALSAEYYFERFDHGNDPKGFTGVDSILRLNTARLPLNLHWYVLEHWRVNVQTSYVRQAGSFVTFNPLISSAKDRFWMVDLALNYSFFGRSGHLQVGVKNLFDKTFQYQDTDSGHPLYAPKRYVFSQISFAL